MIKIENNRKKKMKKSTKKVVVTGGAGAIAYSLLFRIANGDIFGYDQPIILNILDLPEFVKVLEGVKMELKDCVFPLLEAVHVGSDTQLLFEDVQAAILIGSKPRGPGMERSDVMKDNAKIFVEQGKALNDRADPNVLVYVVGNPCNTNCLIAIHHAPKISPKNFHAMTRLDQNRATSRLAERAGVEIDEVAKVTIWGNHSSTQVPDITHATINGKSALDAINDRKWCETEFFSMVQKRGAEVIAARGKSSAASAANAVVDAMRDLVVPTPPDTWYSSGIYSKGNPYGIDEDLVFSFPCRTLNDGKIEIVKNLSWDSFISEKIRASEKELIEERNSTRNGWEEYARR